MTTVRTIAPSTQAELPLTHLFRLTGPYGLYEHARFDRPRIAHGYTTDDNARALVALVRLGSDAVNAVGPYRRFVINAATPAGFHNRLGPDGRWRDRIGSDDCQGRALWGLAHLADHDDQAAQAIGAWPQLQTHHPRANAYATLAMCEWARRSPDHPDVEEAIQTFARRLPRPTADSAWPWPAPRLTYANARIPQALIEGGIAIDDPVMVDDGLDLLGWLISTERGEDGFSFTPVGGRGPGDRKPAFDQQPIEAWAMADACAVARTIDGWFSKPLHSAVNWFLGENDKGCSLVQSETGAGFDGLCPDGVNLNQGAESTLAALASLALFRGES